MFPIVIGNETKCSALMKWDGPWILSGQEKMRLLFVLLPSSSGEAGWLTKQEAYC